MTSFSVKIQNYKCFEGATGFEDIKRVNLIIGKNNAGKSSLIDLIECVVSNKYIFDTSTWRKNNSPQVIFESTISKDIAAKTFPDNVSGGTIRTNHWEYGRKLIGRRMKWVRESNNCTLLSCDDKGISPDLEQVREYKDKLARNTIVPLQGKIFKRLLAERDILPEPSSAAGEVIIRDNGTGITNALQCFLNRSNLPSELVEYELLDGLNKIFSHDAFFSKIVCQLHSDENWEIFLEEDGKGRIALSRSGSGLKTVISVLVYLTLIPYIEKRTLKEFVFCFEELENNIHPALLRRLNSYIYDSSTKNGFSYFLTTHSNVLIDQFSKQKDAQIVHVTHKNGVSTCSTATTYIDNNGILDDLDVRSSDILQANGVIWVEGPSDRIYINRWISLWSDGALKEGTHYQVIFYGGRLLAHLSAGNPEEIESGVSILRANRNAIIMIDSDKRNKSQAINDTKKRIKEEFKNFDAFCWITKGKEIENYIHHSVINSAFNVESYKQVGQYECFFDYFDSLKAGFGSKYRSKKTLLAEKIAPHIQKDDMRDILDLEECIEKTCMAISGWNK